MRLDLKTFAARDLVMFALASLISVSIWLAGFGALEAIRNGYEAVCAALPRERSANCDNIEAATSTLRDIVLWATVISFLLAGAVNEILKK